MTARANRLSGTDRLPPPMTASRSAGTWPHPRPNRHPQRCWGFRRTWARGWRGGADGAGGSGVRQAAHGGSWCHQAHLSGRVWSTTLGTRPCVSA